MIKPRLTHGGLAAAEIQTMESNSDAQRRTHVDAHAVAWLLLCCALWGLNQVAAKAALAEVPALVQAALRSLGAAGLVALWAVARGQPLAHRDGTLQAGLLAGTLFGVEFACIFWGLQFTSASRMVVFIYISPIVVALGMPFIARQERLGRVQWSGLVLAFATVSWAFAEGFSQPAVGPKQWLGDALGVLAGVLWGATTLVIRSSKLGSAAPEKTLLYQLAASGVLLALAAWLQGAAIPAHWSGFAIGAMFFQTVVVSFASYLLWFWLVRHYPAARLASFTLLTPVFGLVFGALLLAEPITVRHVVALIGVAVGIALVNRR